MRCRCPICDQPVREEDINAHIDDGCETCIIPDDLDDSKDLERDGGENGTRGVGDALGPRDGDGDGDRRGEDEEEHAGGTTGAVGTDGGGATGQHDRDKEKDKETRELTVEEFNARLMNASMRVEREKEKSNETLGGGIGAGKSTKKPSTTTTTTTATSTSTTSTLPTLQPRLGHAHSLKRSAADLPSSSPIQQDADEDADNGHGPPPVKRLKPAAASVKLSALQRAQPLAERMRPRTLDEVLGQDLLSPTTGVLRNLILSDKIPSMVLWGGAGTGKTTMARLMAQQTGARFVEINSTSTGVGELKKLFSEAKADLAGVAGRKTMIFCDEIHRFNRSQQDVFLGPVEAGVITLVGATTENPSFKVQPALLSRCRVFTLKKLHVDDVVRILIRALEREGDNYGADRQLVDDEMVKYLAAFADGDGRTGLNLLELAMDLSSRPNASKEKIKASLTKTLVYDRAGDQHYDTISAFHKSVRGSDPHAALYYLARMIQSGEDALYIARRMVVIASEDVGLADNSMLTLATSTYAAAEKIGMPEARINLAHCTVALALAPKSTRAYRGLGNATAKLQEPGLAGLPIPIHLRNAPTRLMRELGYGKEYKYNPSYVNGQVKQEYLPPELKGSAFLEDGDLGTEIDEELVDEVDADTPR